MMAVMLMGILAGCGTADSDAPRGDLPVDDGLDHSTEYELPVLDGATVSACGWLELTGAGRGDDGSDLYLTAWLDMADETTPLDPADPGPWYTERPLGEADAVGWLDFTNPGPEGLTGRDCEGQRIDLSGSTCVVLAAEVSVSATRAASERCGDDTAWRFEVHLTDVDSVCPFSGTEATEVGPLTAHWEPDECG